MLIFNRTLKVDDLAVDAAAALVFLLLQLFLELVDFCLKRLSEVFECNDDDSDVI